MIWRVQSMPNHPRPGILHTTSEPQWPGQNKKRPLVLTHPTPPRAYSPALDRVTHRDTVTNLPTRFLLADRVRQALRQSQRRGHALAMAYLGLNGFQAIHDTHGPEVGDKFLVTVSHRMKETLREGDTLARLGGEEFAAVVVDLDAPTDGRAVLERLVQAASHPVTVGNASLCVRARLGVTLFPEGAVDVDLLLRHADQALLQPNKIGQNRYQMFDLNLNSRTAGCPRP